ncbi:MAG: hypothetical protein A2Z09_04435 [Nitrospirae bacterium RBG_16_43_8]|nr:MAG: hypothetical protein A2Z09_04435 [Nitrospirae bacterium RBG_16_43_8]
MKIECYISASCSSLDQLKENIERALKTGNFKAETCYHRISDEKAMEMKLTGSPTILVNDNDIFPGGTPGVA